MAVHEQTTSTDAPTCTCADGVICDSCASSQIEALSAGSVELEPGMLTSTETAGIVSALRSSATSWLASLGGGQ
jgi:hypothetical protein